MDLSARKEQFSNAYLFAVAAAAGCSVAKPSVDNDSIDWTISNRLPRRPKLDVQLKCMANDEALGTSFSYPLQKKNYDDLRIAGIMVPRILILVRVPSVLDNWIHGGIEELILRRDAYWLSLAGSVDSVNDTSVTIQIPVAQAFTVPSLSELMEKVNQGVQL